MKYIITEEYIKSNIYQDTILCYIDDECNPFYQEENVENWNFRVSQLKGLGAWRWLSSYRHKDIISEFIFSDMEGIDFGGNSGPIWGNTEIIDIEPKYKYRKIEDIYEMELDYIFTSHTLEHVPDLYKILKELYRILKRNGTMIIIVPAWNCERWRAGYPNNTHKWTFSLDNSNYIDSIDEQNNHIKIMVRYTNIVNELGTAGFVIKQAEYTYDNSIFILATKGEY